MKSKSPHIFLSFSIALACGSLAASVIPGTLPGEVQVLNSGQATYEIPIKVAPGTAGMEPDLNFLYNSGAGNGPMGIGWSLGGLSSITRGGQNLFFDNISQGLTYADEDRFFLDGQRLIDVDADNLYWVNNGPNQYRTAVETFTRVIAVDSSSSTETEPTYFTAETKSGLKFIYGHTGISPNSTLVVDGVTYAWFVSRIIDTFGNFIDFKYTKNSYGTNYILIDTVEYSGRATFANGQYTTVRSPYARLRFNYGTSRADIFSRYQKGALICLNKLLSSVEMQEWSGSAWIQSWSYSLSYMDLSGSVNKTSKLTGIAYSSAGDSVPSSLFSWEDNSAMTPDPTAVTCATSATTKIKVGTQPVETLAATKFGNDGDGSDFYSHSFFDYNSRFQSGDIDGDGKIEMLRIYHSVNKLHITVYNTEYSNGEYHLSQKGPSSYYTIPVVMNDWCKVRMGDFDGDGDVEIYAVEHEPTYGATGIKAFVADWTGSGFSYIQGETSSWMKITSAEVADFDGDGRDEVMLARMEESGDWVELYFVKDPMKLDSGTPYGPTDFQMNGSVNYVFRAVNQQQSSVTFETADIDGNGLPDIVLKSYDHDMDVVLTLSGNSDGTISMENLVRRLGSYYTFEVIVEGFPETVTEFRDFAGDGQFSLADVNGDGLPDVVTCYLNSSPQYMQFGVFYNKGEGEQSSGSGKWLFENKADILTHYPGALPSEYEFQFSCFDFTGDSIVDFLLINKGDVTNWESTGTREIEISGYQGIGNGQFTQSFSMSASHWDDTKNLWFPVDLDNNGFPEIVSYFPVSYYSYMRTIQVNNNKTGYINKFTNGLGKVTELEMASLLDDGIYVPGQQLSYPIRTLVGPSYVVSEIRSDTGLDDAYGFPILNRTLYSYAEGRMHLRGLGSLGFEKFVSYDLGKNIQKLEVLEQAYPMTGLTRYTATVFFPSMDESIPGNESGYNRFILAESDSQVVSDRVSGGTLFPMVTESTDRKWEFSGTRTADTYNSSINWWTPTQSAYSQVTTRTWFDNQSQTSPWLYRPVSSTVETGDNFYQYFALNGCDNTTSVNFSGQESLYTGTNYGKITYGNAAKIEIFYGTDDKTVTTSTFSNWVDSTRWFLGRNTFTRVEEIRPGAGNSTKREARFSYNYTTGVLSNELMDANYNGLADDPLDLKTYYSYDVSGNIWRKEVYGAKHYNVNNDPLIPSTWTFERWTDSGYDFDANDRYVIKSWGAYCDTNENGIPELYTLHEDFDVHGNARKITNPNGLVTRIETDALGRTVRADSPDIEGAGSMENKADVTTEFTYLTASEIDDLDLYDAGMGWWSPVYKIKALPEDAAQVAYAPYEEVYYDRLGQSLLKRKQLAGGSRFAYTGSYRNQDGQVYKTFNWYEIPTPQGESLPDLSAWISTNSTSLAWTTTEFDVLGRTDSITDVQGMVTDTSYNCFTRSSTMVGVNIATALTTNMSASETKNQRGEVILNTDTRGNKVVRTYFANGLVKTMERKSSADVLFELTSFTYDNRGNKVSMTDPSVGTWEYKYNAFGELVWQEDARGCVTVMRYDRWGNLIKKEVDKYGLLADIQDSSNEVPEVSEWIYAYDSSYNPSTGAYRFGYLLSETGPYDYEAVTDYDKLGRVLVHWKQVDKQWFFEDFQYDDFGRLYTKNHHWKPAGQYSDFSAGSTWNNYLLTYYYSTLGFLTQIEGSDDITKKWFKVKDGDVTHYDAFDRVRELRLADLVDQEITYTPKTETLAHIKTFRTVMGNQELYQDHSYSYSQIGSLLYKREHETFDGSSADRQSWFFYDNLNRYVEELTTGSQLASPGYTPSTYYDDYGNITYREGKNYVYDSTRKTQVQWWGNDYLLYDANGNMTSHYQATSGEWIIFGWKGFNKPEYLWDFEGAGIGTGSIFWYDNNENRIIQKTTLDGVDDRKTLYLGSFEQEYRWDDTYDVDGTDYDDWRPMYTRIYITGPTGVIGCYTHKSEHSNDSGASTGRSVFLNDYQGNLNVVVDDSSGNVSAHLSYDTWGNRRNPITWARYGNPSQYIPDDADGHPLYRGYTGHEMLDDVGLIHMNGRIYDPLIGRMLSADPFVQTPENLQNYNRYSYVLNNPASYTDPSGYFIFCIAAAIYLKGMTDLYVIAAVMFVAGFADALLMGASPSEALKAGLISAAAAVVAYAIGSYFNKLGYADELNKAGQIQPGTQLKPMVELGRATAHGVAQGGFSELAGGDFGSGFLGGFTGSIAGSMMSGKTGSNIFYKKGAPLANLPARTVTAAVVGGTVAELGGGKFANGAISAAIVHYFNGERGGSSLNGDGSDSATEIDYVVAVDISKNPDSWTSDSLQLTADHVTELQDFFDQHPEWGKGLVISYTSSKELGPRIAKYYHLGVRDFAVVAHGITEGSDDGYFIDGAPNSYNSARFLIESAAHLQPGALKGSLQHFGCNIKQGRVTWPSLLTRLYLHRVTRSYHPTVELGN